MREVRLGSYARLRKTRETRFVILLFIVPSSDARGCQTQSQVGTGARPGSRMSPTGYAVNTSGVGVDLFLGAFAGCGGHWVEADISLLSAPSQEGYPFASGRLLLFTATRKYGAHLAEKVHPTTIMGIVEKFLPRQDRRAALLLYGLVFTTCFNGYDAGIMTVILADRQFNEYYSITEERRGVVAVIPWAATAVSQLFLGGLLAGWLGRLWTMRMSILFMCIGV